MAWIKLSGKNDTPEWRGTAVMNTKGGERALRTLTKGRVKERPGAAAAPSVRFW